LLAGAQFLVQAQSDIVAGHALIQGDTLTALTSFVQGMQQQNETLIQTYVRLSTETSTVSGILTSLGLTTDNTGEALVKFSDDMVTAAGGLQNLTTLWNNYYTDYYSAAERQAATVKGLQAEVTSSFAAIGEDPTESMAKFRDDFTAALPTLSADQVVAWLQASAYLDQLNQAIGGTVTDTSAATAAYQQFVAQFNPATVAATDFENSMVGLSNALLDNISKANALAIANGMAGASASDVANMIEQSAEAGAAAMKQFEAQAMQLAQSLYGTNIDALNAQLTADKASQAANSGDQNSPYWDKKVADDQTALDAANAQAAAAKRLSDATSLLGDFGQIGAITGDSLQQVADMLGVPLDKFGADLGLNTKQLQDAYQQQEDLATAALNTATNTLESKE
jgi:hypothetical protein